MSLSDLLRRTALSLNEWTERWGSIASISVAFSSARGCFDTFASLLTGIAFDESLFRLFTILPSSVFRNQEITQDEPVTLVAANREVSHSTSGKRAPNQWMALDRQDRCGEFDSLLVLTSDLKSELSMKSHGQTVRLIDVAFQLNDPNSIGKLGDFVEQLA